MTARQLQPRCSIEIVNVDGQVVPILDEGAIVEPFGRRSSRYREYWTEEEDLVFTYREMIRQPDGSRSAIEHVTGVHGNIGYELVVREKTKAATLRVDYFGVSPTLRGGDLWLEYEPRSVTVVGSLKRGMGLRVEIELQPGLSEEQGRPLFRWLRVICR